MLGGNCLRAKGIEVLLAADPDLSTFEEFLLPDRNYLLDSVDAEVTRLERGLPMCRRNRDRQAGFPNLQPAEPVMDCYPCEVPLGHHFIRDPLELFVGHGAIGLVLESNDLAISSVVARRSHEGHNRAGARMLD